MFMLISRLPPPQLFVSIMPTAISSVAQGKSTRRSTSIASVASTLAGLMSRSMNKLETPPPVPLASDEPEPLPLPFPFLLAGRVVFLLLLVPELSNEPKALLFCRPSRGLGNGLFRERCDRLYSQAMPRCTHR